MPKSRLLLVIAALAVTATAVAQEQNPKSSNQKGSIRVETDSGRYGVGSDKLDPKHLGVDIYPGAKVDKGDDNQGEGANLFMEWGKEKTHLYVQKFVTTDSADKVLAFYHKQLSKYGEVLECRNGKPGVHVKSELKCDEDEDKDKKESKTIELKAGTKQKQHIVGVTPTDKGTEFGIVYLEQTKGAEL